MSADDPRVNILAEALRDLAPAWTEDRDRLGATTNTTPEEG